MSVDLRRTLGPDLPGAGRRRAAAAPAASSTAYGGLTGVGGFVTRSITLDARNGATGTRVVETAAGFVHAIGLQNPGLDQFLATELPWLAAQHGPHLRLDRRRLARGVRRARPAAGPLTGVAGIEVNLAAPDAPVAGMFDAREPFQAARVVAAVRGEPAAAASRCWPSSATTPPASSRPRAPSPRPGPTPSCSATRCRP